MIVELPCRTDSVFYDFTCVLEGKPYVFTFRWNERGAFWTMSISDVDGTPIISGRRIVVNWFLLWRLPIRALPPGDFVALDESGGGDPGIDELGGRVRLYYAESTEAPTIRTAGP